jgi:hypothetical protein
MDSVSTRITQIYYFQVHDSVFDSIHSISKMMSQVIILLNNISRMALLVRSVLLLAHYYYSPLSFAQLGWDPPIAMDDLLPPQS